MLEGVIMKQLISLIFLFVMITSDGILAQNKPYRVGTTTANFLEMGIGVAGNAMGEAYVSSAHDLSALYWNPAGLAYLNNNEVLFTHQPWIAGIDVNFAGAGIAFPQLGTFAFAVTNMSYGRTEVTTMAAQEGTGETYDADEYAFTLSYGRKIVEWFSFGVNLKYVTSSIWHMSASAMAMDLGVIVDTDFLSPDATRENGLKIGMSICNYGTRMQYDGIDLLQPIDILPNENGNYKDVEGQYRVQGWELPLIFRIGTSVTPILTEHHRISFAVDALHPNNNSESLNVGAQYQLNLVGYGKFFLWGGYRGLFMEDSQYGMTLGAGIYMNLMNNSGIAIGYAYKEMQILSNTSIYTFSITF
jgi:hypothetical protein